MRSLHRSPGFTILAVAVLALGVGASTAIFSVVHEVLFDPVPYDEPERLVIYWEHNSSFGDMSISYPNYLDWRREAKAMEELAVYRRDRFNLTGDGAPEQIRVTMASANLLRTLGVSPQLGRDFSDDEDSVGAAPVAVLTDAFWRTRFGGDPAVIGRSLTLNGRGYEVVGVAPEHLEHPTRTDLLVPIGQFADSPGWTNRGNHPGIYGFGRVARGATLAAAQREIDAITSALEKQFPDTNANDGVVYRSLPEYVTSEVRPTLYLLTGAVGLVLLIACVNVANLLLVRLAGRERELAVRAALGAGRWQLGRQLTVESTLLALGGGALGTLIARGGVDLLASVYAPALPSNARPTIDGEVLAFALALSLLVGIGFGLFAAVSRRSTGLAHQLSAGARGSEGSERRRTRSVLVVAEVSLAIMLLVGAGLLLKSFARVLDVDPGFAPDGVLTAEIRLPRERYDDDGDCRRFWTALLERVRALPGVEKAGITNNLPFVGGNQTSFWVAGRPRPEVGQDWPFAEYAEVDPEYFSTLGFRLLRGRLLDDGDRSDAIRTVVIDEQFAQRHWPDEDPIGQAIVDDDEDGPENRITVVGVVATVHHNGLDVEPPRPQMYFPAAQSPPRFAILVVRADVDALALTPSLRRAVLDVDSGLPISNVRSMTSIIAESLAGRRLTMSLISLFSGVALTLALVGIFGVVSYNVARRTREFGIRMALGAEAARLLRLVLSEALRLALLGTAIGLVGAAVLGRFIEAQLFGVEAFDPMVVGTVAVAILLASAVAGALPASRAARVDPQVALRQE